MLLAGYTGLISLGHAAFLGIGAYTEAMLLAHGMPLSCSRCRWPVCSPACSASLSACRRCA